MSSSTTEILKPTIVTTKTPDTLKSLVADTSRYFVTADEIIKPTEARERFRKHFLQVYAYLKLHQVPLYADANDD